MKDQGVKVQKRNDQRQKENKKKERTKEREQAKQRRTDQEKKKRRRRRKEEKATSEVEDKIKRESRDRQTGTFTLALAPPFFLKVQTVDSLPSPFTLPPPYSPIFIPPSLSCPVLSFFQSFCSLFFSPSFPSLLYSVYSIVANIHCRSLLVASLALVWVNPPSKSHPIQSDSTV